MNTASIWQSITAHRPWMLFFAKNCRTMRFYDNPRCRLPLGHAERVIDGQQQWRSAPSEAFRRIAPRHDRRRASVPTRTAMTMMPGNTNDRSVPACLHCACA